MNSPPLALSAALLIVAPTAIWPPLGENAALSIHESWPSVAGAVHSVRACVPSPCTTPNDGQQQLEDRSRPKMSWLPSADQSIGSVAPSSATRTEAPSTEEPTKSPLSVP